MTREGEQVEVGADSGELRIGPPPLWNFRGGDVLSISAKDDVVFKGPITGRLW